MTSEPARFRPLQAALEAGLVRTAGSLAAARARLQPLLGWLSARDPLAAASTSLSSAATATATAAAAVCVAATGTLTATRPRDAASRGAAAALDDAVATGDSDRAIRPQGDARLHTHVVQGAPRATSDRTPPADDPLSLRDVLGSERPRAAALSAALESLTIISPRSTTDADDAGQPGGPASYGRPSAGSRADRNVLAAPRHAPYPAVAMRWGELAAMLSATVDDDAPVAPPTSFARRGGARRRPWRESECVRDQAREPWDEFAAPAASRERRIERILGALEEGQQALAAALESIRARPAEFG